MKKILSVLAILLAVFFIVACDNEGIEDSLPKESQKTLADYEGVWEDEENDTIFIAISSNGIVKYYCGSHSMGNGLGVLDKNTLSVPNEYTGMTDKFTIRETKDGLRINCSLKDGVNIGAYCSKTLNLKKTTEATASFAGDVWTQDGWFGSTLWSTWSQWRINVTSNNSAIYYNYHRTNGISKEHGMYCVQRLYHNKTKFLYSHFTGDSFGKLYIFWYDGKSIYNNGKIEYRF